MVTQTLEDLLDAPYTPPSPVLYGRIDMALQEVALVKGVGKVPFDPNVHDRPVLHVDMTITPLEGTTTYTDAQKRDFIKQSRIWSKVQESLTEIGFLKASELAGKYAKLEWEKTGEKYVNKNGQERDKTYPKFLKIFNSEDEAMADWIGESSAAAAPKPVVNDGKAVAKAFLDPIIKDICKNESDLTKIMSLVTTAIASNPLIAPHYDATSADVITLINQYTVKA